MPRLRAGNLRLRIEIQGYTTTYDALGAPVRTWSTSATRWASLAQLSAAEAERYNQPEAAALYKATFRDLSSLTTTQRLKLGSRIFEIVSVNQEMEANHVTSAVVAEKIN